VLLPRLYCCQPAEQRTKVCHINETAHHSPALRSNANNTTFRTSFCRSYSASGTTSKYGCRSNTSSIPKANVLTSERKFEGRILALGFTARRSFLRSFYSFCARYRSCSIPVQWLVVAYRSELHGHNLSRSLPEEVR
jgi:hypothetical protein